MRKLKNIFWIFIVILICQCLVCITATALYFLGQYRVVANQFPLQQKWSFEAGSLITATPIAYEDKILFRTTDELYVLHALTGELAWTYSLPMDKHADPPLVRDGYVVLTHLKGTTALDLETGDVVWEAPSNYTRVDAHPVAASEDKVVIVDETIMIRDIKTGELLREIKNPYARSDAIVKLQDNNLYVVFADQIRNYDFDSGELIWQNDTQQWSLQNGVLDSNTLYLERREDGIAAYNLTEQRLEWERIDLPLTDYPPTKYKDTLYIGTRGADPVGLDVLTGQTLWKAEGMSDDDYQTPLIFDGMVFIRGLFQKKIYALDMETGEVIGHISLGIPDIGFSTNASYSLGPVQSGDMIVFPAGNKLLAFEK